MRGLRSIAARAYRRLPAPILRRLQYVRTVGLHAPVTFNEHLLAEAILRRDPRIPPLVDKITAKKLIGAVLGDDWIVPTLYAGDELPLPDKRGWPLPFVVKPSHRSAAVAFVRSEQERSWPQIEALCRKWTSSHFDGGWYEWFYRELRPRILVEPYIGDGAFTPPDYKFFVFGGRVRFIQVDIDRFAEHRRSLHDRDWTLLPYTNKAEYPRVDPPLARPPHLDQMIAAAEMIGSEWTFIRVDFYDLPDGPKFGEVTFCPDAAVATFDPPEYDWHVGRMWPRRSSALRPIPLPPHRAGDAVLRRGRP